MIIYFYSLVAKVNIYSVPYESFFKEVDRVLKPKGVFAAVGYSTPSLIDPKLQAIFSKFYIDTLGSNKLPGEAGCFWQISRPSVDNYYPDVPFPYSPTLKREFSPQISSMPVEHFFEYVRTMSAYRTLLTKGHEDPVPGMTEQFLQVLKGSDKGQNIIDVKLNFFCITVVKS